MPLLHSAAHIRAALSADRAWCLYALGDLAPGFFEHTSWHATDDSPGAILMLYRAFGPPVLFALGAPALVAGLLDELVDETELYLSVRPDVMPLIHARFKVADETPMWRMTLDPTRFLPVPGPARRLALADLPALLALYSDGQAEGAADFFSAAMLEQGAYFGIEESGQLVAAAGTHLLAPAEGVAAIGNVYTRRDRRGRGLAAQVTSAVTAALVDQQPPLDMIGLNVRQNNAAALRVYERLGFARYCAFFEGRAYR